MRASQLFAVCRERFRRVRNPMAVNENLSFVVVAGNETLPNATQAGKWLQNNPNPGDEPDYLIVGPNSSQGQRWTYNLGAAFPHWRRLGETVEGNGDKDSMVGIHNHRVPTGELYARIVVMIRNNPPDGLRYGPLLSIHDVLTGQREFLIEYETIGVMKLFRAIYKDKAGVDRTIQSEPVPMAPDGGAFHYIYDIRVGLHGVDGSLEPFLQVFRPESRMSYVTTLDDAPGSGYSDLKGVKMIAVLSGNINGLIPASQIRISRVGIGNLVKEALP